MTGHERGIGIQVIEYAQAAFDRGVNHALHLTAESSRTTLGQPRGDYLTMLQTRDHGAVIRQRPRPVPATRRWQATRKQSPNAYVLKSVFRSIVGRHAPVNGTRVLVHTWSDNHFLVILPSVFSLLTSRFARLPTRLWEFLSESATLCNQYSAFCILHSPCAPLSTGLWGFVP